MRLYVIEGLGGAGNSIDLFYRANERQTPNSQKFKMLYNPQIRFKNRAYIDFNCSLKLIKLRTSLSQTVQAPDIYLRSKVPEDMYDTIVKFAEMRKLDRANLVANFDLFPSYENLVTFERKYGDSITYQDQFGVQKRKKKKRAPKEGQSIGDDTMTGSLKEGSIGQSQSAGDDDMDRESSLKKSTGMDGESKMDDTASRKKDESPTAAAPKADDH